MERFTRLAPPDDSPAQTAADTFRFVFSNEKVGRDGHVVRNAGIQTANYQRNNIVLFAHDDKQPPIGRGTNIDTSGVNCQMDITFADRDVNPFAGMVRDLVAGKWLKAVSMSWQPLEWQYSTDRNRPGGIDFTKVDLLEVSVVPLPALPDALLDARSHGVNMRPLGEWAERSLDMGNYHNLPRTQLEAICRAAAPAAISRRRRDDAGRLERLREIQATGERIERLARLRSGHTAADRQELEGAVRAHRRALKHHRALGQHHESLAGTTDTLADVHRALTSTLKELGYGPHDRSGGGEKLGRHLNALARCARALKETTEEAADSHAKLGRALSRASAHVARALDGAESSDPDDTDPDKQEGVDADDNDDAERAARRARLREIRAQ